VDLPGAPFEISRLWFDEHGHLRYAIGKDPYSKRRGPNREGVIALINALEDILQIWNPQ